MGCSLRILCGAIACLWLPAPALAQGQSQSQGQPAPPARLTLGEAVDYALAHYPAVRASLARLAQADAGIDLARTAYLPSASMLWQSNRATFNNIFGQLLPQGTIPSMSGPVLAGTSGASAWGSAGGVLGSWQPFDLGLRHAGVLEARARAGVAAQAAGLTRLQVAQAAAGAFLALVTAEKTVTVAQANLDRWRTVDQSVHVLVDNQLRAGADASQADAELAAARTGLIQAQTSAEVARSVFAELLEVPSAGLGVVSEPLLTLPAAPVAEASVDRHPLALEQQARVDLAASAVHVLDRSYSPEFNLEGALFGRGSGVDTNGHTGPGASGLGIDRENWAAGISVTFDPLQIFALHQEHKAAQAGLQAERAQYDQTVRSLDYQVEEARSQLRGAQQIAENTPIQLAAARTGEIQSQAQYKAGLAAIVQVAQAEGLLAQAEVDDAQARINVWRAMIAVAAAQGDLRPVVDLLHGSAAGGESH